ncbi:ornithine cyclodeaminase family protein [Streptomyces piniterrae]|uniref:Ornithine cyclodeaminase family protein n=1 Tax=Streptomyces piniterrae TaxID=2571125 RepID=A0A4U0NSS3_9ACTN|nr:ornithine cyclodeaminase family protein [Streptomyces piniterrae]TJZ57102.1 ornithine cyclodeaminase family protein [Streptomyces piniterrae]
MTRILTRRDLLAVLDPGACLEVLRDGFRRAGAGAVPGQRIRTDLPFPGTATALIPGLLSGIDAYTVKVNAKFPGARPALRGVICLHSGRDGELLALLDSATLTAWRTGLAAALGTHLLAAPDPDGSAVLGVIGAGAQAELTLLGLRELRRWGGLVVHDTDAERAAGFAARHGGTTADSAAEVAARADTLLLATWSRTPLLALTDIRPGQHLTTLGADEPGKRELAADLLDAALLAVDDRQLAAATGALANAGLSESAADATLGEILRRDHPGRTHPEEITVYAPVGLPWQDLAVSWAAHQEAERRDIGVIIDLLG